MSWYEIMKPFRTNLRLVMKKYLCGMHAIFPGVDYSYNRVIFNVTIKYLLYFHCETIASDFFMVTFLKPGIYS